MFSAAEKLKEAVRKSALALLSAAQFADDHGDKKAAKFYDRRAHANLKLIGMEPPFMKVKSKSK